MAMGTTALDILCIEDTIADFQLIERELRKAGLLGFCLRVDSRDALHQALAQRQWDLVLSDYSVPGMYFTDTLKFMLRAYSDLPLILVSGTIGGAKASAMVEVGAWGHVSKLNLSELVPVVKQALARKSQRESD